MAKRFLLREEYFGGLLYDREKFKQDILNRWQIRALQLTGKIPLEELVKFLQNNDLTVDNYDSSMDDPIARDINSKVPSLQETGEFIVAKTKQGILVDGKLRADSKGIRRKLKYPMLSAPIGSFIEITNVCNMACRHCYNVEDRQKDDACRSLLTREQIFRFFDQAYGMGLFFMKLQGGETTLHPHWREIAQKSIDCGMATTLYTGGYYKGREHILEEIVNIPFSEIRITFAGLANLHDALRPAKPVINGRGKPTFEELNKTLDFLLSRKANVKLNYVLGKNNMNQVEEFVKLMAVKAKHYGKPFDINLGPQRPFGEGFTCPGDPNGNNMPRAEEFYQVNQLVERLRDSNEINDAGVNLVVVFDMLSKKRSYNPIPRDLRRDGCGLGKRVFSISYRGDISICNFMISCKVVPPGGNIKEQNLEELWFESSLLHLGRQYEKEQCRNCDYYTQQCQGICPAMALYTNLETTKDWSRGDPGCFKHFLVK